MEHFKNKLEGCFKPFEGPEYNEEFGKFIEEKAKIIFPKCDATSVISKEAFTDSLEVAKILKEIRGKGAPGIDKITSMILKQLPTTFINHISDLINASIIMSLIPNSWKKALVTLIPKTADSKRNLNDFRPISLLSVLSKVCERIIGLRIYNWTTEFNLISCYQSGFVKVRPTRDHILRIIQDAQMQNL